MTVALSGAARAAEVDPATAALAERLEAQSQLILERSNAPEASRAAIPLLKAANQLNPKEARYLRSLVDLHLAVGNSDEALADLTRLRALVPGDQLAQIQFVDLSAARLESADAKVDYLRRVAAATGVPRDVRSHALVQVARLQVEKGDQSAANEAVDSALQLNPVNLAALEMLDQRMAASGDKPGRMRSLVNLLRANVVQPNVLIAIGRELAAVGLIEEALFVYDRAISLSFRIRAIDPADLLDYASLLLVGQQPAAAERWVATLLQQGPSDPGANFLAVLIRRANGTPESREAAIARTREVLTVRLAALSQTLATGAAPESLPTTATMPDVLADVARLQAGAMPELNGPYLDTLADLAWLAVFLEGKPADPTLYRGIEQLGGEQNPIAARIAGWNFLLEGKKDEAKQKLSAVADTDPLAAVGLLRLREGSGDAALAADARKLIIGVPNGVVGAMVHQAVRPLAGEGQVLAEQAAAVRAELDKFPRKLLDLIPVRDPMEMTPEERGRTVAAAEAFYVLKVEPVRVGHDFGDAMLMRLSLTNKSDLPLSIGPGGLIRAEVVFEASARSVMQQSFPVAAIGRLSERVRLDPLETITQVYRVDGWDMRTYAANLPSASIPIYVSALTNPVMAEMGVSPGPAGYRKQSERVLERGGSPMTSEEVTKLSDTLRRGSGDDRISTLERIGALAPAVRLTAGMIRGRGDERAAQEAAGLQQLLQQFEDMLARTALNDASPEVRGWAGFQFGMSRETLPQRLEVVERLLAAERWPARLLGVHLATDLALSVRTLQEQPAGRQFIPPPPPTAPRDPESQLVIYSRAMLGWAGEAESIQARDTLVKSLESLLAREGEAIVKQYAEAALELVKLPPTPAPENPTAGGAGAPAAP